MADATSADPRLFVDGRLEYVLAITAFNLRLLVTCKLRNFDALNSRFQKSVAR